MPSEQRSASLLSLVSAEVIGTFFLTFVDAGGASIGEFSADVSSSARAVAAGSVIMALTYAFSNKSGAHFNPAVTLAFAVRGVLAWREVWIYWLAQIAGAVIAAGTLRMLLSGYATNLGVTQPKAADLPALGMEILLTSLLVTIVLSVATRHRILGLMAAIAAGATVALCGLFSRPISGASMNPARSLGPALVSANLHHLWIYIVGPLAGAILGNVFVLLVHPHRHAEERSAACGEDGEDTREKREHIAK